MDTVSKYHNYLDRARTATVWVVWLPKAFFMKWTNIEDWQKNTSDPTIWFPLGFFPPDERERIVSNYYGEISIVSENISTGISGITSIVSESIDSERLAWHGSERQLQKMSSEYA